MVRENGQKKLLTKVVGVKVNGRSASPKEGSGLAFGKTNATVEWAMKILPVQNCLIGGFTRADAIMVLFSLLLLALVVRAAIWVGGEKRRIWVCAHRMKTLGRAFDEYAQEHNGALPPAFFDDGQTTNSWDSAIAPYLGVEFDKQNSSEKQKELEAKIAYLYQCPSDKMPRRGGLPRSYSMPMYDINRFGWPPAANSLGGVGLYLDVKALQHSSDALLSQPSDNIPTIKISMVPSPANTALLVECRSIQNVLWSPTLACISSSKAQFPPRAINTKGFHSGKMNYLMLDGHVESFSSQSLSLLPTGNADYPNIWTIKGGN
jgi:prepilin-type processing-associated H-X9-DG protein